MDDDDDFLWTSTEDDEWVVPRGKIYPTDLLFPLLGFGARVLDSAAEVVRDYQHLVGGRINYLRGQDDFFTEASQDIENYALKGDPHAAD